MISNGTFRSTITYVSKLESQLKLEMEKRIQLELEIKEIKKLSQPPNK